MECATPGKGSSESIRELLEDIPLEGVSSALPWNPEFWILTSASSFESSSYRGDFEARVIAYNLLKQGQFQEMPTSVLQDLILKKEYGPR